MGPLICIPTRRSFSQLLYDHPPHRAGPSYNVGHFLGKKTRSRDKLPISSPSSTLEHGLRTMVGARLFNLTVLPLCSVKSCKKHGRDFICKPWISIPALYHLIFRHCGTHHTGHSSEEYYILIYFIFNHPSNLLHLNIFTIYDLYSKTASMEINLTIIWQWPLLLAVILNIFLIKWRKKTYKSLLDFTMYHLFVSTAYLH